MRNACTILLVCVLPTALAAQSADGRRGNVKRRFSLVLDVGGSVAGPGGGLSAQLRRAGFDDTSPESCFLFCSGPIPHPTHERPGGAASLSARFAVGSSVAVGVGYGTASLGGSIGYRDNGAAGFGDYILSHWDATMAWAAAFWKPLPGVRLGGGPGWYQLENTAMGSKTSRVGAMVEAGAELPADRRIFLNLALRLHLLPATDVYHAGTAPLTLRPNWSHASLLVGLGVRL